MGRIKTKLIKRVTFKLLEEHKDKFTTDFTKNKELVEQFTNTSSKKLRNAIAGYLARQVKHKDRARPRSQTREDLSKFY